MSFQIFAFTETVNVSDAKFERQRHTAPVGRHLVIMASMQ